MKLLRTATRTALVPMLLALGLVAAAPAHAGTCASNDNLACAEVLPNTPGNAVIPITNGSAEPNENAHAGFGPVRSVWYRWTAPSNGDFTTQTCETPNSAFDTVLGVYANGTSFPLTEIASNDDGCGLSGLQSRVHFTATSGTQYLVAVDSKAAGSGKLTIDKAPANDDLLAAQNLGNSLPVAVNGATNLAATKQPSENAHAGDPGGTSVWYEWTAPPTPATGSVVVETCGSGGIDVINTLLAVYADGAAFPLTPIVSNDNACGQQSRLVLPTTANTTYLIAVDGSTSGVLFPPDQGDFDLDIIARPPNDDLADAAVLSGPLPLGGSGTLVGATAETGEPGHAGVPAFESVWYEWTPQADGAVSIDTCDSATNTRLAVYTGDDFSDPLQEVTSNDDTPGCGTGGTRSRVSFTADDAATYRIAVDSAGTGPGAIDLDIAEADLVDPIATIDAAVIKKRKGKAKFTFSGTDNATASGDLDFTCKLDGRPAEGCTSPITYRKLKKGTHSFRVTATDEAGNVSAPAERQFKSSRRRG